MTDILRLLTAGESHGPQLTAILEGMIAGLPLRSDAIDRELARRQVGYGSGGRMRIEHDHVRLTGGVLAGTTTGAPIALTVENRDYRAWAEKEIAAMTVPRPGHADLTGALKYGYRDLRPALERASARETAVRVAAGAICKAYLAVFDITIGGYVTAIGGVEAGIPDEMPYPDRFAAAESNDLRCPVPDGAERMRALIWDVMQARDTVGGIFEVVALGLPPGLGSHVQFDRKLDARLLWAMGSIPAVKGAEIGPAFANAALRGTQVHDEILLGADGRLQRPTNRAAGGLEGGVTNGEPLVVRGAMKPIATTLTPLRSVDLAGGRPSPTNYERSDFSAVSRAVVVAEAMLALVLADELLRKLGGDSLGEQRPRFAALAQPRLSDLPMDDQPWRFDYDA